MEHTVTCTACGRQFRTVVVSDTDRRCTLCTNHGHTFPWPGGRECCR